MNNNKGGKRKGAGRPRLIKNPATIGFRIEQEDKDALTEKFGAAINKMFRDWVKKIISG